MADVLTWSLNSLSVVCAFEAEEPETRPTPPDRRGAERKVAFCPGAGVDGWGADNREPDRRDEDEDEEEEEEDSREERDFRLSRQLEPELLPNEEELPYELLPHWLEELPYELPYELP